MSKNLEVGWPVPPDEHDPAPPKRRRAWGQVPYEERYRRQRTDLLRAAARLAGRRGYEGTRVAEIVAEAGLSKSTFYEHFTSKEDCFVELHRRTSTGMLRAGVEAAERCDPARPVASINAVIRALVGYVSQDPRLADVIRGELTSSQPAVRDRRAENIRQIVQLFAELGRRLRSPLDEAELHLAGEIIVNGVIAVLPDLRRSADGLEGRALAQLCCRALGLDPSDA